MNSSYLLGWPPFEAVDLYHLPMKNPHEAMDKNSGRAAWKPLMTAFGYLLY